MTKTELENKLSEINTLVTSNYNELKHLGVLAGLSGISLFKFYYSKYLDIDEHADFGVELLSTCIDNLNNNYNFPTFCTGIAGFGWVFDHLEQEEFMDADADVLLPQLDDYLHKMMVMDMNKGNYDFLHGAIGYAFYFLNRYRNTNSNELKENYKTILLEFVSLLKGLSEEHGDDSLKWLSVTDIEKGTKGYNLSLSHGMSSIVGILTKLNEFDDFKNATSDLLIKGINYIRKFKTTDDKSVSLFPSMIPQDDENINWHSRIAWCYGDLGIGIRFWYASKALKDKALKNEALAILKHAAKRISKEDSMVTDAGICHGSYGNAQIFYRMYKETNDAEFKDASDIWIKHGLSLAIHEDGYAGYKQWRGLDKDWRPEVSLLEGIAGIGLTIIDQLADFDTNWDECLMIS